MTWLMAYFMFGSLIWMVRVADPDSREELEQAPGPRIVKWFGTFAIVTVAGPLILIFQLIERFRG